MNNYLKKMFIALSVLIVCLSISSCSKEKEADASFPYKEGEYVTSNIYDLSFSYPKTWKEQESVNSIIVLDVVNDDGLLIGNIAITGLESENDELDNKNIDKQTDLFTTYTGLSDPVVTTLNEDSVLFKSDDVAVPDTDKTILKDGYLAMRNGYTYIMLSTISGDYSEEYDQIMEPFLKSLKFTEKQLSDAEIQKRLAEEN